MVFRLVTSRRCSPTSPVFPIELGDVERAKAIVLETSRLSSRDALHVAIMERQGVSEIMTFDRGFAERPGIRVVGV